MTMETLANVKNPPVVYAKQANIKNGGRQQVNNGVRPSSHATENKTEPSKLLEHSVEERMDIGTEGQAGYGDSQLAALEAGNRAKIA